MKPVACFYVFMALVISISMWHILILFLSFFPQTTMSAAAPSFGTSKRLMVWYTMTPCPPCEKLKPILDKWAPEFKDVEWMKIDANSEEPIVQQWIATLGLSGKGAPTVQGYVNGKLHGQITGLYKEDDYVKLLRLVATLPIATPTSQAIANLAPTSLKPSATLSLK